MTATSSYGYGRYNVCNEWMEFAKARIPLLQATSRIDRSEPHSTLQMHLLALRDVELYIRRHMNIAAPINRLPDELLARIMALAVRSHVEHAGKVTQYCPPLNFVRVSRRWRWVVSTFPNIWSAPRLSLGKEAFAVMLSKAKAALLHLSWGEHDCANYAYLDDTISLHVLAQAKTISLVGEPQHISEVLARFTHSAPILYELQIQNTRRMRSYDSLWPHEIFCGSTPRLASLTLVDIAVPIWASSIFCNSLRRIEVSCNTRNAWVYRISSDEYKGASFHNLLNALGRMVHAEHISFKECISFSLAVSEPRPSQSISLPHLRTLTIEDRISSCVRFLAHVKIPSRCTIRMRSSWLSDVPFDTVCDVGALARSLPRDMPATRLSIRCRTIPSLLDCRAEMVFTLRDISHGILFILHLTDVPLDTTAQQHALCAISSALPLRSVRVLCTSFLLPFSADMWLSSFSAARDLRTITLADSQISDLARLLRDRKADAFPRLCALRCTDRLSIRSELALRPRLAARRSNGRFIILGKRASDAKCSSTQVMVVDAIGQVSRLRLKQ